MAGAALLLAGFVVFQWVSFLRFGQTGLQIVLENQQSLPSQVMLQAQQPIWTLWLVPLCALAALVVGWRLLRAPTGGRTLLTILLFGLGVVTLYPFWMTYTGWTVDFAQTTDLLASGFWLALLGNGVVTLTALVASR
jgi:hypothetical protein